MSNTFGKLFRLTSFGESHGEAIGAIIDGCPSNIELSEKYIQDELDKRKPGKSQYHTDRKEEDKVQILSGVFENKTTGSPIACLVKNKDVDSSEYSKDIVRPGHADLTYWLKYGNYDYRGGGRSSGRETVARVCGGAIAKKILSEVGTKVVGHVKRIGEVETDPSFKEIEKNTYKNEIRCAEKKKIKDMKKEIKEVQEKDDSIGGLVEIIVRSPMSSLGEPVFDKIEAELGKAILSLGATKGIEFGAGFECVNKRGSEMNDQFKLREKQICFEKNDAGGMLGGITTGQNIVLQVPIKPTPSIGRKQQTINLKTEKEEEIEISGRHDPCICPRILPVIESMTRIVLVDLGMRADKISRRDF